VFSLGKENGKERGNVFVLEEGDLSPDKAVLPSTN
jgi:hypothetical protein